MKGSSSPLLLALPLLLGEEVDDVVVVPAVTSAGLLFFGGIFSLLVLDFCCGESGLDRHIQVPAEGHLGKQTGIMAFLQREISFETLKNNLKKIVTAKRAILRRKRTSCSGTLISFITEPEPPCPPRGFRSQNLTTRHRKDDRFLQE